MSASAFHCVHTKVILLFYISDLSSLHGAVNMEDGVHNLKIDNSFIAGRFIHLLRLNDNKAMYQFEVCGSPPPTVIVRNPRI